MINQPIDHALEFLLAFDGRVHHLEAGYWLKFEIKRIAVDGRVHHLEAGYWLKFEIKRIAVTGERPHGLSYSFTLHTPDGTRLVGFDNAHRVPGRSSRFRQLPAANDHWHRTESDPGRPYQFKDVETLIDDFFDEVERVLGERGIGTMVVAVEETRRSE